MCSDTVNLHGVSEDLSDIRNFALNNNGLTFLYFSHDISLFIFNNIIR